MKSRLLFVALTLLSFTTSVIAQDAPQRSLFKLGSLESGDTLMISVTKSLTIRAVVRDDGKLALPGNARERFGVPELRSITAGGLTISQLYRLLEERYGENNVTVWFLGKNHKSGLDRIIEMIGKP